MPEPRRPEQHTDRSRREWLAGSNSDTNMPALSDLEVQVVDRSSGSPLATVNHQGTQYVVADAGEEFLVKVKLINTTRTDHKVCRGPEQLLA